MPLVQCLIVAAAMLASGVLVAYYRGISWHRPLLGIAILVFPLLAVVFMCRSKGPAWIKAAFGVCIAFLGPMGLILTFSIVMPVAYFTIQSCSFLHDTPSQFWKWFGDFSLSYNNEPIFDPFDYELEYRVHRVDPHLSCLIGDAEADGSHTLTITPNNDRGAYSIAERVVAEAPALKNWRVVACEQRKPLSDCVSVGYGTWIRTRNVFFVLKDGDSKANIELYVKGDEPRLGEEESMDLPDRVIRASLGERDYMFLIGRIDVFSDDTKIPSTARSISVLPAEFDNWASKTKRDFRTTTGGPDIILH